jgi:hypothetical protein
MSAGTVETHFRDILRREIASHRVGT